MVVASFFQFSEIMPPDMAFTVFYAHLAFSVTLDLQPVSSQILVYLSSAFHYAVSRKIAENWVGNRFSCIVAKNVGLGTPLDTQS